MNEAALIRAIPYKSDSAWLDAWDYGLPLVSPGFFALQKEMLSNLPRNLMLVGDFAGLPSLDAAVESSNVYSQAILER